MIRPGEIQKKAHTEGVRDQQIEKDYVLSWILQGIAEHEYLANTLIFKGGTILKKVHFEDYRYSEDLDFTLLDNDISNQQILDYFNDMFNYVKDEANIPLKIVNDNEHEDGGISFFIGYIGPLGGIGANKQVKIDISKSEKLQFKPELKDLIISYSDQKKHKLLCYSLAEVVIEKLRSIMQRMQPRDFYDLWYLLAVHGIEINFLKNEFIAKCKDKQINHSDFFLKLSQRKPLYKARWQVSMKDQIKNLPEFEKVERELMRHLKKLEL